MKTLSAPGCRQEILERLNHLSPDTPRLWGKMNSAQMVCHLADAFRGVMGETRISEEDLLQAALRLRPDRILLGELRGPEAFTFLRAVNTGHPGSITTVHADSPSGAIDQIVMMSLLSGVNLDWASARAYAVRTVDLVVQMRRADGVRWVSEVELLPRADEA